jgi:plastocyanin
MKRLRALVLAVVVAAVLASAGAAAGPTVTGSVGPGFSISLVDASGQKVTNLSAGGYTFVVHDLATLHDFHLIGPGVDQATDVEGTGDSTWDVTLANGAYRFFCDVHPTLKGSFTVGSQPPPPTRKRLLAKVGPGAKIAVTTPAGARVKSLVAGPYSLVVRDVSKVDDFHLIGPGVNRKTSVAKKLTATWKLTLKAGTYRYRSDAHPKLKGSFVVKAAG